jgi:hypothetical protein
MKPSSYVRKYALFLTIFTLLVLGQGCKPRLLPSTNVPATRLNKSIVTFLEQYKAALEKRSVDGIMELVAKDFKDNMGSEDPRNYLDYLGLKERLEKTLPRINDLRIGMFVQHIAKLDNNTFEVVFYFNKHVLAEMPSGEKWISTKEISRMILRKRHDKDSPYEYEILSGI